MIKQFPTIEDRTSIHQLINNHSKGNGTRNAMMRAVAAIAEKYNLTKIPIFGYSVRIFYSDHAPGLPIISIESSQISEDCPTCHSNSNRYLLTQKENFNVPYDVIAVNCIECGCIYSTKGNNGRNGWASAEGE